MRAKLLTAKELCAILDITRKQLDKWVRTGLPVQGKGRARKFNEQDVAEWLLEEGLARAEESPAAVTVAATREEAARLLGVNTRTLASWLTMAGFPGKSGRPGQKVGHFPIEEINAWRARTFGEVTGQANDKTESPREERWRYRAALDRLVLEEKLGRIVLVEPMERFMRRAIATAKRVLDALPDKILARLPPKTTHEVKRKTRQLVAEDLDKVYTALAELLEGDQDEAES